MFLNIKLSLQTWRYYFSPSKEQEYDTMEWQEEKHQVGMFKPILANKISDWHPEPTTNTGGNNKYIQTTYI